MTQLDSTLLETFPEVLIQPSKGWINLNLGEIWTYRELLFFLIWRDVSVRYKQTILGGLWAIIQPVATMIVFSIFFGNLAQVPSDGLPYPLFAFAALVPWTFFANGLQGASNSLVSSAHLITKVYFPRLVIPTAAVVAGIVDFGLAFIVLLVLMLIYGRVPSLNILWLPFFVLLALCTALGVGLWLAALNVQFRDIRYVIPFLTQFWLFITPVAYSSNLLTVEPWRTLYGLNPMVGVVEGFRWALLSSKPPPNPLMIGIFHWTLLSPERPPNPLMIAVSIVTVALLLVSGAFYFRRMESKFADIV